MENFRIELLGNVFISSYLAWFILSIIGAVTATLVRNHLTTLKSYPVNLVQILTGLLLTFIFIRFSVELTNYVPNAFGAFLVGLSGNEIALGILKKFLLKKKEEKETKDNLQADAPDIGGGGIKNNPPKP